jgi:protein ImuB
MSGPHRAIALLVDGPRPLSSEGILRIKEALADVTPFFFLLHEDTVVVLSRHLRKGMTEAEAIAIARERLAGMAFRAGAADTPFLARLAARTNRVVAPEEAAAFLRQIQIGEVAGKEMAETLSEVGVRSLFDLLEIPPSLLVARWGREALALVEKARGAHGLPPAMPTFSLEASTGFEAPLAEKEPLLFAGRRLAARLMDLLREQGLTTASVETAMHLEEGGISRRRWSSRHPFDEKALAERVKWHLEALRTERAVCALSIRVIEVAPEGSWQGSLEEDAASSEGFSSLERAQAALGGVPVLVPGLRAHRHPRHRSRYAPFPKKPPSGTDEPQRFSNAIPPPWPSLLCNTPRRIELLDEEGKPVSVSDRGELSGRPSLTREGERISGYSLPWTWHDPAEGGQGKAYMEVSLASGRAYLLFFSYEEGTWFMEGIYD